jgi:DNA-binding NtrC family response regulator
MSKVPYPGLPVLIIDDEEHFLDSIVPILRINGITNVECCQDSLEVMPLLKKKKFSVILLDIKMPGIKGTELLPKITAEYPEIPVIMVTSVDNEISTVVDCIKQGAFDYLVKPVETAKLITTIQNALESAHNKKMIASLKESLLAEAPWNPYDFKDIITQDKKMLAVLKYIEAIARFREPVLITGETGTGKESLGRFIHQVNRQGGDFITANIAGLDAHLFADTIFGHEIGAFTGAVSVRKGLIEQAVNGTLFLDEIGELAKPSQISLLRLIQSEEYCKLGSDKPLFTNAHLVLSTTKDINVMKETGGFRKDIYYRLNTHHIHLPPLRERKEDIPLLLDYFIKKGAETYKKEVTGISPGLIQLLSCYDFPGNILELESMVYDAVSRHSSGSLSLEVFLEKIKEPGA